MIRPVNGRNHGDIPKCFYRHGKYLVLNNIETTCGDIRLSLHTFKAFLIGIVGVKRTLLLLRLHGKAAGTGRRKQGQVQKACRGADK